jgi:hypothetical protein
VPLKTSLFPRLPRPCAGRLPTPLRLLQNGPLVAALLLSACAEPTPGGPPKDPTVYTADCDPILGQGPDVPCAMPWPSSLYLEESASSETGYALRFSAASLPANNLGAVPPPENYKHLDGYGPSTQILALVPNLDLTGLAGEESIERSLRPDAPIVLLEDHKGALRRVPYFVELDRYETDPALQTLFVRPAEILKEATRYLVAFRGLRSTSGAAVAPAPAFVRLRDGNTADVPVLAKRQARFDRVFATLASQGIDKQQLVVAWDFVTASNRALHGDLLHMRDDALRRTGAMGATLQVSGITEYVPAPDGSGKPVDPDIAVEVRGTFEVPNYLADYRIGTFSGTRIRRDAEGKPSASGSRSPEFWLRIPHSAVDGKSTPHGLVLYGHGLLGEGTQVRGGFNGRIANRKNLIFVGAGLTGMSSDDQASVIQILTDVSRFPHLAERLHQGLIEWVLLARGMRAQLESLTVLGKYKIKLNRDELFYSGISQGGIFGASFVALSPDVERGHLGVPGSNYSLLLQRSTDFTGGFSVVLGAAYPSTRDQAVVLSAIQLLWDATDPVTHYRHLSVEPYPGNRAHHVLLGPARGDYQVSVLSNEILARSGLGVPLMAHYDDERTVFAAPGQAYPHSGSGVVLWHFGNPWPAPGNLPPVDKDDDPHELPRRRDIHNDQMVHFFRTGEILDVCGGKPCWPDRMP